MNIIAHPYVLNFAPLDFALHHVPLAYDNQSLPLQLVFVSSASRDFSSNVATSRSDISPSCEIRIQFIIDNSQVTWDAEL